MTTLAAIAGGAIRTAGAVSPAWGAAVALPLFARIAPPREVADADAPTMSIARRSTLRVPGVDHSGTDIAVYEWGHGDRLVVLAHGWDGRASQFATLVRELVAEGHRVVAFDAPAHGESAGRRTYVRDWIDAFAVLEERHGRIHALVGHSFGGLASLIAAGRREVDVARVVTVAAPGDPGVLFDQFRLAMGFGDRIDQAVRDRFARTYFPRLADPFQDLSPLRHPLVVPLLVVHDERDRLMPATERARIIEAHPHAEVVTTSGHGHTRILVADEMLDAVVEFVTRPDGAMAVTEGPALASTEDRALVARSGAEEGQAAA